MRRKVILDVDTGTDDAVAIMLAAHCDELEILGICSVNGNRGIEFTTENSLRVVDFLGKDYPVFKGCGLPLTATLIKGRKDNVPFKGQEDKSENVHEDYVEMPPSVSKVQDLNAVSWLVNTLMSTQEKVTLVPVGPLTNIATALRIEPRIKDKIEEIVIMGGGYRENNITPAAEFNFYIDPDAAKIVLNSGCKITLVPLDATHSGAVSKDLIDALGDSDSKISKKVSEIMASRLEGYNRWQPMKDNRTVPVHDALAVAYLVEPGVLEDIVHCNVDVDVSGGICDGQSVCDVERKNKKAVLNVHLALKGNAKKFEKVLLDKLTR